PVAQELLLGWSEVPVRDPGDRDHRDEVLGGGEQLGAGRELFAKTIRATFRRYVLELIRRKPSTELVADCAHPLDVALFRIEESAQHLISLAVDGNPVARHRLPSVDSVILVSAATPK